MMGLVASAGPEAPPNDLIRFGTITIVLIFLQLILIDFVYSAHAHRTALHSFPCRMHVAAVDDLMHSTLMSYSPLRAPLIHGFPGAI